MSHKQYWRRKRTKKKTRTAAVAPAPKKQRETSKLRIATKSHSAVSTKSACGRLILKSKDEVRDHIWELMESTDVAAFPRPVYHRIPNFKGAQMAATRLAAMRCFKNAKLVKVNPDSAQLHVRKLCLMAGKLLLVPSPRLKKAIFNIIEVKDPGNERLCHYASTKKGMLEFGRPLRNVEVFRKRYGVEFVDLVVVGSVAVDPVSGFRIGKGEGYADLECAVLNQVYGLTHPKYSTYVAVVHKCQVLDKRTCDFSSVRFEANRDVVVDYIVTPETTVTIKVDSSTGHRRRYEIDWSKLSAERLRQMPQLAKLKPKK